jgi:hypothetical protein
MVGGEHVRLLSPPLPDVLLRLRGRWPQLSVKQGEFDVASISFCGVRRYRLRWMAGRDGWRDGQMLSSRWPPLILPNIPIKVDGFGTSVSASHGTQKACRCRHHDGMDFTVPGQPAS